jgi:pimeloyl-ACP methyl ester carboxylesterase
MELSNQSLVLMRNGQKLNVFQLQCEEQKDSFCDTTLFFIHGAMGCLTQFSDQFELYRGHANIVAYDTIGCGSSEKPTSHGEYSTDSFTAHTIEIFEKYSTSRNILVGHSYGTAQIARLCEHLQKEKHVEPINTIIGVVLIGTMDTLPPGGKAAFRIFSLPLCVLNPMQSWMTKTYMKMAYSTSFDPILKKRAVTLAGK